MKGRVHSQHSENRHWIRFTCLKNHRLLDFITRNDDQFHDLSLVSHLPLRNYKRLSSKWKNTDGYLFKISMVCMEQFWGYLCSKGWNLGLSQRNLSKQASLCCTFIWKLNTSRSKTILTEWGYMEGAVFLHMPQKDTDINWWSFKLRVLMFIQSAQDKVFSCSLFTVLYAIISIISSTILKLHVGLVLFLDKICSHEFI